jgi:DNA-binding transcriptional MerR regulator
MTEFAENTELDNLPLLDVNALMATDIEEINFSEPPIIDPDNKGDNIDTKTPVAPTVTTPVIPTDNVVLDDYWNTLKTTYGDDYELPEELKKGVNDKGEPLTPKDKLSLLTNEIFSTTLLGKTAEDDAFVRKYLQQSADPNFNKDKFLQQIVAEQNMDNLPMREFMFQHLKETKGVSEKRKEGFTFDEINEFLDGENPLKLKSEYLELKEKRTQLREQQQVQIKEEAKTQWMSNVNKAEEDNKIFVQEYTEKIKTMRNIDGFELGETDKSEFIKALPHLVKRNIKDVNNQVATSKAEDILLEIISSPEKSMMLLPFLWMYETGKLKNYTSKIREDAKKTIDKTLSSTRIGETGNSDFREQGAIDVNKLYQG